MDYHVRLVHTTALVNTDKRLFRAGRLTSKQIKADSIGKLLYSQFRDIQVESIARGLSKGGKFAMRIYLLQLRGVPKGATWQPSIGVHERQQTLATVGWHVKFSPGHINDVSGALRIELFPEELGEIDRIRSSMNCPAIDWYGPSNVPKSRAQRKKERREKRARSKAKGRKSAIGDLGPTEPSGSKD